MSRDAHQQVTRRTSSTTLRTAPSDADVVDARSSETSALSGDRGRDEDQVGRNEAAGLRAGGIDLPLADQVAEIALLVIGGRALDAEPAPQPVEVAVSARPTIGGTSSCPTSSAASSATTGGGPSASIDARRCPLQSGGISSGASAASIRVATAGPPSRLSPTATSPRMLPREPFSTRQVVERLHGEARAVPADRDHRRRRDGARLQGLRSGDQPRHRDQAAEGAARRRRRTTARASCARRRARACCRTRTSSRSTTSASTATARTSPRSWSRA